MSDQPLLSLKLESEQDIVHARQRARHVARLVGFDRQAQTSIATAVSEIARNTVTYAGGGFLAFSLEGQFPQQKLSMTFRDTGPGISDLQNILSGSYVSPTGMGVGIVGTRRLMDSFEIQSAAGRGTIVSFAKYLPRGGSLQGAPGSLVAELSGTRPDALINEVLVQNRDLLASMANLEVARSELSEVNSELESTNRGVMARCRRGGRGADLSMPSSTSAPRS